MIEFKKVSANSISNYEVEANGEKAGRGSVEVDKNYIYLKYKSYDAHFTEFLIRCLLNVCIDYPNRCVSVESSDKELMQKLGFKNTLNNHYEINTNEINLKGSCKE